MSKILGYAILVTYHGQVFEGRQEFRLRANEMRPLDYQFKRAEVYKTKKLATTMAKRYEKSVEKGSATFIIVTIQSDGYFYPPNS